MELRGFTAVMALLWNDRMDLFHVQDATDPEDPSVADNAVYGEEPDVTEVPCRISFGSTSTPEASPEQREQVSLHPTIFCAPDVEVRAGDRVVVRRQHSDGTVYATYTGFAVLAGFPSAYDNHREFQLNMEGDA